MKQYINSYTLRFFITFVKTPWLDGKHVVFGEVADEESKKVVDKMHAKGSSSGTPAGVIVIEACGEY